MTAEVKHRRGTESQVAAFTPAAGEIIVDMTNNRAIVGDGATVGGHPLARLDEVIAAARTAVSDASVTATATSRLLAYASLTAARTVTLPAASAFPTGVILTIVDETGACDATKTISVLRAGSDTINGANSLVLKSPYAYLGLVSDGAAKWTIVNISLEDAMNLMMTRIAALTDPAPLGSGVWWNNDGVFNRTA